MSVHSELLLTERQGCVKRATLALKRVTVCSSVVYATEGQQLKCLTDAIIKGAIKKVRVLHPLNTQFKTHNRCVFAS